MIFDWSYLETNCQYPVPNVGALVSGPEPEINCGEPATAIARWYEEEEQVDEDANTMLLCQKHLDLVLLCQKIEKGENDE